MSIIANLERGLTHFADEHARLAIIAAAAKREHNDYVEEDRDANAAIAEAIDTLLASDLFVTWAEGLLHEASNHTNGGETVTPPASTEAQPGNPGRAKPFEPGYWSEKRETVTPEQFAEAPTLKEAIEAGDVKDGYVICIAWQLDGEINVRRVRYKLSEAIAALVWYKGGPLDPNDWKLISVVSSEQHASDRDDDLEKPDTAIPDVTAVGAEVLQDTGDTAKQVTSNPTTDKVLKTVADTGEGDEDNFAATEGWGR